MTLALSISSPPIMLWRDTDRERDNDKGSSVQPFRIIEKVSIAPWVIAFSISLPSNVP